MTKIVIIGAGFAGLKAALELEKRYKKDKSVSVTLIDKHDYHLYSPSLYEVAASEEEFSSISQLEKSVVLPLPQLLSGKRINFIQGEASFVDQRQKKVKVGIREIGYDYLVLAAGSGPEFYNIPGAQQHGLPLKNLTEAFRIRNALEFAVQSHTQDAIKQYIRFVVAGGGHTGVELAGEMSKLADILAWKYNYPREKIEIVILESSNQLIPDFNSQESKEVVGRLLDLGVEIKILSLIFKVTGQLVELLDGERIHYDVLVWTAGVRAANVPSSLPWPCDRRGHLQVDGVLRVKGFDNIFAIGDIADTKSNRGLRMATTAQAGMAEAKFLAQSLPKLLQNKKPREFAYTPHPFVVSVGGKWALVKFQQRYLSGYIGYLVRLAADFRYYSSLIGWVKALKYTLFRAEIFGRND